MVRFIRHTTTVLTASAVSFIDHETHEDWVIKILIKTPQPSGILKRIADNADLNEVVSPPEIEGIERKRERGGRGKDLLPSSSRRAQEIRYYSQPRP